MFGGHFGWDRDNLRTAENGSLSKNGIATGAQGEQ